MKLPFDCTTAGRDRHCLHYEEGDGDCCLCDAKLPPSCEECGGFVTGDEKLADIRELCACKKEEPKP